VKTPVRWLEAGNDAPDGAAELLSAAPSPPPYSEAVRYRLAVGVAKTAATPVGSVWTSLLAKGAFVAAIGGGSGYLVHVVASKHDAPPVAAPAAGALPSALPPLTLTPPTVAVEALPALQLPTAPPEAPKLKLDPRLEEAELLEKARALVGSNPAQALRLTSDYARQFPKGRLGAEADLIAAQSLLGMGNVAAARTRAQASLKRYPNGLYARQLREIAAP
jgi:hypothetical protein